MLTHCMVFWITVLCVFCVCLLLQPLALVSHKASRWLLRSGPVTLINTEKKNKTSEVHLIAFNDLLLLAKGAKRRYVDVSCLSTTHLT